MRRGLAQAKPLGGLRSINRRPRLGFAGALLLALFTAGQAAEPARLSVASPLDYEVFQRQTAALGTVRIRGAAPAGTEAVEARFTGHVLGGDLPGHWQAMEVEAGGGFHGAVQIPAGGWYRLELRSRPAAAEAALVTVEHVGVGEVFIGAGQSNSTNYGAEKQQSTSGLVSSFGGESWQLANDPQPGAQDHSSNGSFWPAFGDALVAKYHVPIGVAVTGCGATSVREWLPKGAPIKQEPTTGKHVKELAPGAWECTGELFEGLMRRVAALGPNGFRAILWHQGESDAGQARAGYPADRQITGGQYRDYLTSLIAAAQQQAGWKMPWFVAEATYHSEKDSADEEFRAAQRALWQSGLALEGPDTDALGAEYRAGVHFNARGLQAHGKAWAEKVSVYLDGALRDNAGAGASAPP